MLLQRTHAVILTGTVLTCTLVLVLVYTVVPTYKSEVSKENPVNAMNRLAVGRSARAQQAHKVDNRINWLMPLLKTDTVT